MNLTVVTRYITAGSPAVRANFRNRIRTTQSIVGSFLSLLQLKQEEVEALHTSPTDPLSQAFFDVLVRVSEVHRNAKRLSLLGSGSAGLEVMEKMATYEENGYEIVYRWIQHECLRLNAEMPDITPILVKAVACLQARSTLFQILPGSQELYPPHGTGVPMEFLSSDPIRYINDMLAWIHKSLMSEKELLLNLLKACSPKVLEEHLQPSLALCLEGVCRPFKIRVEQIVENSHGPVLLYRMFSLMRIYTETVSSSLRPDAALYVTFQDLKELLSNLFSCSLNCTVNGIVSKFEVPKSDLLPVVSQQRLLLLLRDLLESHSLMPVPLSDKKQSFSMILSAIIEPLLSALSISSTHLTVVSLAVYMLNSIYPLRSVLCLYEYTDDKLEMLQAKMETHVSVIAEEQTNYILQCTGLIKLYEVLRQVDEREGKQSLASNMDESSVKSYLDSFRQFLDNPSSYLLPIYQLIVSPKLKESVKNETRNSLISVYERIFLALTNTEEEDKFGELSLVVNPEMAAKMLKEKF
ncbi:unnamed protein product [Soboliphyme baturini]|uniref:Conserved oligomeric Golgi complex subunit 6 n=1 Tax=Soboliphyme baturini TaxID=241478 RepID=A0A183IGW9_9BILA|nr:unnamed protein product [Soboliphyme baturini]